ncbi:hypothetical protein MM239_08195 [Belliella sp. DSM 111904]|uniref:Uncharacterized protein n=1 Tax=Belliella filtrata TaxID=2923435 RepID=A0ABS9UYX2_9BACT|nr:hypothetical protein [Belliella filtrata]MCH7409370.1 hypothetical protein [Belliella filtrata]
MKNLLTNIIYLFLTSFLFFNCSTHYIGTWDNYDKEGFVNESGNLLVKNDTLGISHAFNKASGKVQVRMENYTDQPLLINMTKSTMTVNGRAMGFVDGKSTIFGILDQDLLAIGNTFVFNGEMESNPNTIIIPPHSYAESTSVNVIEEKRNLLGQRFDEGVTNYPLFDQATPMRVRFFNESNSPIKLTSYVNYSTLDKDNQPTSTNTLTQNYFLSSYAKVTGMTIKEVDYRMRNREDVSSFYEVKGVGVGLTLALAGIIVAALIIDPDSEL